MKKIAFVDSEGLGDIGGGQRGLLDILKRMNKEEFYPILICPGPSLLSIAALNIGIETYYLNFGNSQIIKKPTIPFLSFLSLFKLYKIVKKNKIDLLLGNSYLSGKYTTAISILTKIPTITMIRCIRNRKYLGYIVDLFLINFSTRIICNTKLAAEILKKRSKFNQHILTIHNGMDIDFIQKKEKSYNSFRNKYGIDNNTKIIGMVAMFVEQKGHLELFKAAEIINESFDNIKFVLVGSDFNYSQNEKRYRTKLSEMGLIDSFIFTGFVDDVKNCIAGFDISLLLSQDSEGLPRALMESMALSKPVIATNVGGISELVIDGINGFLIFPRDVDALVNYLKILLNNPDKIVNMGEKGRSIIKKNFELKSKIIDFENIFKELIG